MTSSTLQRLSRLVPHSLHRFASPCPCHLLVHMASSCDSLRPLHFSGMAPKVVSKQPRKSRSADSNAAGVSGTRQSIFERLSGTGFGAKTSRNEIEATFDKLRMLDRIEGGDVIGVKGVQQLCADLSIKPESLEAYVLVWRLGSLRQSHITRQEWLIAMYTYSIDSVMQLKVSVSEWTAQVKADPHLFTEMYNYLFDYIRGESNRLLPYADAAAAWEVLLSDTPHASLWIRWVRDNHRRDITRDLWQQCLLFLSTVTDAQSFAAGGKWPAALDDFAQWWKAQEKP